MGGVAFSLAFFVPLYFLSNGLILRYREHVLALIEKTRLMQFFKASKVYHLYQSLPHFGGGG
jgi:hypothetical protein